MLLRGCGFLVIARGSFEPCTTNPLEDGLVLAALLVRLPALTPIVRGKVVADVPGTVGRPCGFDKNQTLNRISDVHNTHRIFVVLLTILIREDALGIWRLQLENHVVRVTEDAGQSIRAARGKDRLDFAFEEPEIKNRAGLDISKSIVQLLAFENA